jgi:hypothetical protein
VEHRALERLAELGIVEVVRVDVADACHLRSSPLRGTGVP